MSGEVHSTQQTLTALEVQQQHCARESEAELAAMARDDADLLLLSDYSARALTSEEMAVVEERLRRDDAFRALAMTLLGARDFVRARVEREAEAATGAADAAWRRLRDRETRELRNDAAQGERRGEQKSPRIALAPTPRHRTRLLLRVGAATLVVAIVAYFGGLAWQFVRGSEMLQDRWEVKRERGMLQSFTVRISNLMSITGLGPGIVVVRHRGVLDSRVRDDDVQEAYADGEMITVHASATEGRELQLEMPLITLRTKDAHATITSQEMGARVLSVSSGRVVVTVAGEPNRTITIGEGFELAVKADGTIDHTPAKGVSGYRRLPVEEYSK